MEVNFKIFYNFQETILNFFVDFDILSGRGKVKTENLGKGLGWDKIWVKFYFVYLARKWR